VGMVAGMHAYQVLRTAGGAETSGTPLGTEGPL